MHSNRKRKLHVGRHEDHHNRTIQQSSELLRIQPDRKSFQQVHIEQEKHSNCKRKLHVGMNSLSFSELIPIGKSFQHVLKITKTMKIETKQLHPFFAPNSRRLSLQFHHCVDVIHYIFCILRVCLYTHCWVRYRFVVYANKNTTQTHTHTHTIACTEGGGRIKYYFKNSHKSAPNSATPALRALLLYTACGLFFSTLACVRQ